LSAPTSFSNNLFFHTVNLLIYSYTYVPS
jgi:hypothetical protein